MKQVILVTNIPNPYRIPLFNVLSERMKSEGMELHVVFAAMKYQRRLFTINSDEMNFRYTVLDSEPYTSGDEERTTFNYRGFHNLLIKEKPWRVIVSGYSAAALQAFYYKIKGGASYLIWTGSVFKKGRNDSFIRRFQRWLLTKYATAFICYGSLSREYLISLGAAPEKTHIAINTVDTKFFYDACIMAREEEKHQAPFNLLYIGYLTPRKNVFRLLALIKSLSKLRQDIVLNLVGDGSERTRLEGMVSQLGLEPFVKFHGFKQKNELPAFMIKADVFLFQTDFDIWGLTLNEAMASGLCCLSSDHAGATRDLIQDKINGFKVDFSDTPTAVKLLDDLLNDPARIKQTGKAAATFIQEKANLHISSEGFIRALNTVK